METHAKLPAASLAAISFILSGCTHLEVAKYDSEKPETHDGQDADEADERVRQIERVINGLGFTTIHESLNAVEAWLGSLPGHVYANVRQPLIHTLNLSHLMSASALWAGLERNAHLDGPPLFHAVSAGATPFTD